MKNRTKQRANRRLKNKEEMLDKRNGCGVKDLTAYNAVAQKNPTLLITSRVMQGIPSLAVQCVHGKQSK